MVFQQFPAYLTALVIRRSLGPSLKAEVFLGLHELANWGFRGASSLQGDNKHGEANETDCGSVSGTKRKIISSGTTRSEASGFVSCRQAVRATSFNIRFGGRGGETRRKALGLHGVLTAEEARTEARKWLGERAMGKDPIAEQAANRAAETVEQLCDRYLAATEKSLVLGKGGRAKKPSTLVTDRGRIKRHIIPLLGKKKVRELSSADVNRFIRDITTGKTADGREDRAATGEPSSKGVRERRPERRAYCPASWPLLCKKVSDPITPAMASENLRRARGREGLNRSIIEPWGRH